MSFQVKSSLEWFLAKVTSFNFNCITVCLSYMTCESFSRFEIFITPLACEHLGTNDQSLYLLGFLTVRPYRVLNGDWSILESCGTGPSTGDLSGHWNVGSSFEVCDIDALWENLLST